MTTAREILAFLEDRAEVHELAEGAGEVEITGPATPDTASPSTFVYLKPGRGGSWCDPLRTPAILIVAEGQEHRDADLREQGVGALVIAANPRLTFAETVQTFFARPRRPGIDPSASVDSSAVVGQHAQIGPGSVVGPHVVLGDDCTLRANVTLLDGVILGDRVEIGSGTVVGNDGFGYERDGHGRPVKLPHLGTVRLQDDVEIGACSCIDRGTIGDTVIGARSKIDNLVHVAHNVSIGEDTLIAAHAMIAGSTRIGSRVWIGPGACVSDGLTVGDDAFVTIGSVVTRAVAAGDKVTGNFAVPHEKFLSHMRSLR
jgi:UDP-3-O-[3-hydroxymyristoyl] glucosamine N-acyltransferase